MVQTTRGCPYACTFCHDGIAYMNPTRAFSPERVFEELAYVEARVKTPTLQLADLNWGMFKADLQTATWLAESRRRSGWPRNIMVATAKNQKERIVDMSRVLGDALQVGASVQSTDPEVLKNIKRTNISLDAIVKMAKGATDSHTGSFTELILGLPGDTVEKHTRSVFDMVDAGIQDLRLFQFILLPGTEGSDLASRAKYQYRTGFRVLARCFGRYPVGDEEVWAAETQEICLGNNTMPSDDYFACRSFDLTIAIFNNGGILKEFFRMAEALGVKRSAVLQRISQMVENADPGLQALYAEFKEAEAKNFFATREELDTFLARPGAIDEYLSGVYGVNHIYKARTTALMTLFSVLARIAHEAVTIELREHGFLDPLLSLYLDELLDVTIARKSQLNDLNRSTDLTLHFDFYALHGEDYLLDPRRVYVPNGIRFTVRHSETQQADLRKYYAQYRRRPGWFRAVPAAQRFPPERGALPGAGVRTSEPDRRYCADGAPRGDRQLTARARPCVGRCSHHIIFVSGAPCSSSRVLSESHRRRAYRFRWLLLRRSKSAKNGLQGGLAAPKRVLRRGPAKAGRLAQW